VIEMKEVEEIHLGRFGHAYGKNSRETCLIDE
jgi:hypothetical protein